MHVAVAVHYAVQRNNPIHHNQGHREGVGFKSHTFCVAYTKRKTTLSGTANFIQGMYEVKCRISRGEAEEAVRTKHLPCDGYGYFLKQY